MSVKIVLPPAPGSYNAEQLARDFAAGVEANIAAQRKEQARQWGLGYDAGRHAQADTRTGLESPAYQRGYTVGVQNATRAREFKVEADARIVARRRWRFVRALAIGFVVGCLLAFGLVKCAKADPLSVWERTNELCQGGSGKAAERACGDRYNATQLLLMNGWFQGNHGVWVSPAHAAAFSRIVRRYDAMARENPGMIGSMQLGFMDDLRRAVPDEAIFALWNGRAGEVLAGQPYAASMLMFGLPYLERTLSGRNDPRFRMVLRP